MAEHKYAFIADNKVFSLFSVDETSTASGKWKAAFSSNPVGMDITAVAGVNLGWVWNGENFTSPEGVVETFRPELAGASGLNATRKYAFLVEDEVFEIVIVQPSQPMFDRYRIGFSTPHIGMDVTEYDNVEIGSIWDGTSFSLPVD